MIEYWIRIGKFLSMSTEIVHKSLCLPESQEPKCCIPWSYEMLRPVAMIFQGEFYKLMKRVSHLAMGQKSGLQWLQSNQNPDLNSPSWGPRIVDMIWKILRKQTQLIQIFFKKITNSKFCILFFPNFFLL